MNMAKDLMGFARNTVFAGVALTVLVASRAKEPVANDPTVTFAANRRFVKVGWKRTVVVGGTEADTILLKPIRMTADQSSIYVFDAGRNSLIKFDSTGHLVWIKGREGSGPGEYKRVRDLAIGFGAVLVVDEDNNRVAKVDMKSGSTLGYVDLRNVGRGEWIQQLGPNRLLSIGAGTESMAAIIDTLGTIVQRIELPLPGYQTLDPIARQIVLSEQQAPTSSWSAAYTFGMDWIAMSGAQRKFSSRLIEQVIPPTIVKEARGGRQTVAMRSGVAAIYSLSTNGEELVALAAGASPEKGKILDYYEASTGRYRESRLLPGASGDLAHRRNDLCMLTYPGGFGSLVCLAVNSK
jgi:hypothetical protein